MPPWGKALYDERTKTFSRDDPENYCLPDGVPRYWAAGGTPSRIIQTTGMIVVLYEIKTMFRQIYMDGRTLRPDAPPTWLGYSTGSGRATFWEAEPLDLMIRPGSTTMATRNRNLSAAPDGSAVPTSVIC